MFKTISTILIESIKHGFDSDYGSNRWIASNPKFNVYWSHPHFESQFQSRYPGFTLNDLREKLVRSIKELANNRLYY